MIFSKGQVIEGADKGLFIAGVNQLLNKRCL